MYILNLGIHFIASLILMGNELDDDEDKDAYDGKENCCISYFTVPFSF